MSYNLNLKETDMKSVLIKYFPDIDVLELSNVQFSHSGHDYSFEFDLDSQHYRLRVICILGYLRAILTFDNSKIIVHLDISWLYHSQMLKEEFD